MCLLNTTEENIRLDVLANADESMIGLELGNSKIIPICYDDFYSHVISKLGKEEINNLRLALFKYHVLPVQTNDNTKKNLVVMKTTGDLHSADNILDVLKFYQSSDIFSCYTFYPGNSCPRNLLREHAIFWPVKSYAIEHKDFVALQHWFETHSQICATNHNEKFKKMRTLYLDSYLLDSKELSFVILSVILEMMVNSKSELRYRISRSVSLFLSNNKNEMKDIFQCVKRLYDIRSKYVHEGTSIDQQYLFELREIVRKILVLMYEQEMHKAEFDFNFFSDELTYAGYLDK